MYRYHCVIQSIIPIFVNPVGTGHLSGSPQWYLSPSYSMAPSRQGCAFCSNVAKFSTSRCIGNLCWASKTACRTKGAAARAGLCSKRRPRAPQRTSVDDQMRKMKLQLIGLDLFSMGRDTQNPPYIHKESQTLVIYSLDLPAALRGLFVLCNVALQTKSIPAI